MSSLMFTEEEFWLSFMDDLQKAVARVIIQSPFATTRRVRFFAKSLRSLIARGVPVCVYLQEPRDRFSGSSRELTENRDSSTMQDFDLAVQTLIAWGVHVNLLRDIHAKFAVIDEQILWEGSLNIMSFSNTREHMRRWDSSVESQAVIGKYNLSNCAMCQHNLSNFGFDEPTTRIEKLGELLARQRSSMNLTQRDLAAKCGLTHGRIARIESGKNLTVSTLFDLSHSLELEALLVPTKHIPAVTKLLQELASPQDRTVSKSDSGKKNRIPVS